MFVNSDFTELLKLFSDNSVRYLIIGGYAFIQYAEPRYTKDLDLWISTDTKNAKSVYAALKAFGAPLAEITEDDFSEEGYFYLFLSIENAPTRASESRPPGVNCKELRASKMHPFAR